MWQSGRVNMILSKNGEVKKYGNGNRSVFEVLEENVLLMTWECRLVHEKFLW